MNCKTHSWCLSRGKSHETGSISFGWLLSCLSLRHLTRGSCETCSSPSWTSSVPHWLESAALNDLFGSIQPCLTLPKHYLGNIYSAHCSSVQQTSPLSLSPCQLGELCTFSTCLNGKRSAPELWCLSARSPVCSSPLTHGCTRGSLYRAKPHRALSCSHISYSDPALGI